MHNYEARHYWDAAASTCDLNQLQFPGLNHLI